MVKPNAVCPPPTASPTASPTMSPTDAPTASPTPLCTDTPASAAAVGSTITMETGSSYGDVKLNLLEDGTSPRCAAPLPPPAFAPLRPALPSPTEHPPNTLPSAPPLLPQAFSASPTPSAWRRRSATPAASATARAPPWLATSPTSRMPWPTWKVRCLRLAVCGSAGTDAA